jgi:hypothetical protein
MKKLMLTKQIIVVARALVVDAPIVVYPQTSVR